MSLSAKDAKVQEVQDALLWNQRVVSKLFETVDVSQLVPLDGKENEENVDACQDAFVWLLRALSMDSQQPMPGLIPLLFAAVRLLYASALIETACVPIRHVCATACAIRVDTPLPRVRTYFG